MKFQSIVLSVLLSAGLQSLSVAAEPLGARDFGDSWGLARRDEPVEEAWTGQNVTDPAIEFTGPIKPGGKDVTLTGTIESIWDQLHKLNPNYDTDFKDVVAKQQAEDDEDDAAGEAEDEAEDKAQGEVEKRSLEKRKKGDKYCNKWRRADKNRILHGIDHLNKVKGKCCVGGGPKRCGRVSCAWDSGIFLCNDKKHQRCVDCHRIAKSARKIISTCPARPEGEEGHYYLSGQLFMGHKWNTVVRWGQC